MFTVNIHEAKTKLSFLLAQVEAQDESVLICRNGKPVAELRRTASKARTGKLPPPNLSMAVKVYGDLTAPLVQDELPEDFQ